MSELSVEQVTTAYRMAAANTGTTTDLFVEMTAHLNATLDAARADAETDWRAEYHRLIQACLEGPGIPGGAWRVADTITVATSSEKP